MCCLVDNGNGRLRRTSLREKEHTRLWRNPFLIEIFMIQLIFIQAGERTKTPMRIQVRLLYITLSISLLCHALAGCRNREVSGNAASPIQAQDRTTRYPLHGLVLGVSTQTGELTVKHEEIHGFMPAMTMNFKVKDSLALHKIVAGDEIDAVLLVPANDDNYLLDQIRVLRHTAGTVALPPHTLLVGEQVPDIAMVNQDGKAVHLGGYAGKVVLLTFIYTRCPLPNACPRISGNFAHIFHQLSGDPVALRGAHMISVTLDPDYDRPEVLRAYGINFQASAPAPFSDWEFTRTSPQDLRKLADAFGLQYTASNNQITHTMRTILISPERRVINIWYGSDWKPDEVGEAVRTAAKSSRSGK